jgi:hypothetical protein
MQNYAIEINNNSDLVKARLGLRNYILKELKSSPFVVVRAVVAMTALGELILASAPDEAVTVECSVVNKQGGMYLQYHCDLPKGYSGNAQNERSLANFSKVMEESKIQNSTATKLEITGLMLLKTGY